MEDYIILQLTAEVVSAYFSNNKVNEAEIPKVIDWVGNSLRSVQDKEVARAMRDRVNKSAKSK